MFLEPDLELTKSGSRACDLNYYVLQPMNGWIDGWMDEWMDGWMDGWMGAQTDRWNNQNTVIM